MTSASSLAQEPLNRSLDAIRKSEAKLRQVLDTIRALVWSNRTDGANDFSNQRWQDYTGISSEDARPGVSSGTYEFECADHGRDGNR